VGWQSSASLQSAATARRGFMPGPSIFNLMSTGSRKLALAENVALTITGWPGRPSHTGWFLLAFAMQRQEHVVEHIISYQSAQRDALRLIEGPVDAKIDSALAVLFLSFRE
jgi:hypothetical protein